MPYAKIQCVLFDLDETLYSKTLGLEQAVSRRANEYVAAYLKLSPEEALDLRRRRIKEGVYGTTLEWLLAEKGLDTAAVEDYFAFIHPENEADSLGADSLLRAFLVSLRPLPIAILTNSTREHADRVLGKLGIGDLFSSIFDIRTNGLKGKPRSDVFYNALAQLGTPPENCLFVDDVEMNVAAYRALGGIGVLFDEFDSHTAFPGPRIRRLEELRGFLP
jgi:putative hydrolase of the HAD superfamily